MTSTQNRSGQRTRLPAPPPAAAPKATIHVADILFPLGLALWALGVSRTRTTTLGSYGLLAVLPIIFYLGLGLLIVSAAMELARHRPSRWRMSIHAIALVVMLYGTAPLLYSEGRYSWLYKTIGVVQYVNEHGQLDRHIDIYQNWPGFFAFAAWFGKVAGVTSPLAYAKWAQLVFELAALPLLYLIYEALSLTVRQRWLALLLYSASNWIGQDYFSPQALGTLLSLGIMAIALRWLYVRNALGSHRRGHQLVSDDSADESRAAHKRRTLALCAALVLIYSVLTFTHELSPYMLIVQLGALGAAGLLRPRWLSAVLAVVAVGYLLPRFTYVNNTYGLLNSFGNFFGNVAPPKFPVAVSASQRMIARCAEVLSIGLWCLAIAGAWLGRRSTRRTLTLVLLTFSPIILLAVEAYGQEGILRVYLFSLPWTAALAAVALAGKAERTRRGHRAERRHYQGTLRVLVVLGVILGLFFPAFFGSDEFAVMTPSEVTTIASFLQNAPAGDLYYPNNDAPLADTARYNLFTQKPLFGTYGLLGVTAVRPDIAKVIADSILFYTRGRHRVYLVITPSMIAYNQAYQVTPASTFPVLLKALAHSAEWHLVLSDAGSVVYELKPTPTAGKSH